MKVKKLNLPLMSLINKSRTQTAFTVSIESKKGISTGISAYDRAKTVKVAIKPSSTKKDIVSFLRIKDFNLILINFSMLKMNIKNFLKSKAELLFIRKFYSSQKW